MMNNYEVKLNKIKVYEIICKINFTRNDTEIRNRQYIFKNVKDGLNRNDNFIEREIKKHQ